MSLLLKAFLTVNQSVGLCQAKRRIQGNLAWMGEVSFAYPLLIRSPEPEEAFLLGGAGSRSGDCPWTDRA